MNGETTKANSLRERAQELSTQIKQRIEPVDTWVRTLARERPLVALAGALGIGYLIGRLIRR
jgi:ElaB/YqjD/DUF883 family membrane-anchored ribosome-binding protein